MLANIVILSFTRSWQSKQAYLCPTKNWVKYYCTGVILKKGQWFFFFNAKLWYWVQRWCFSRFHIPYIAALTAQDEAVDVFQWYENIDLVQLQFASIKGLLLGWLHNITPSGWCLSHHATQSSQNFIDRQYKVQNPYILELLCREAPHQLFVYSLSRNRLKQEWLWLGSGEVT